MGGEKPLKSELLQLSSNVCILLLFDPFYRSEGTLGTVYNYNNKKNI